MTFYCTEDGVGPAPMIDWFARQQAVDAIPPDGYGEDGTPVTATQQAAQRALFAERLAVKSHVVGNGNLPAGMSLPPCDVARLLDTGARVEEAGEPDVHGGRLAVLLHDSLPLGATTLCCPVCGARVRVVDLGMQNHSASGTQVP